MKTLIYGTGNMAKLESMRKTLEPLSIELLGLKDLNIALPKIEESGSSPLDNARIKALTYYRIIKKQAGRDYPVFSCDSGLYFENAPEELQPGTQVRTVNGRYLNDEEMINHYSKLAKSLGGGVTARYRNAICLVLGQNDIRDYMGDDIAGKSFFITAAPHPKRIHGFPLDSLSVHIPSGKYFYDLDDEHAEAGMADMGFRAFFRRELK